MPEVEFAATPRGIRSTQLRTLEGGRVLRRVTEAALPTLRVVPSPRLGGFGPVEAIGWGLPHDDTSFSILVAGRVREAGAAAQQLRRQDVDRADGGGAPAPARTAARCGPS